MAVEQVVRDLDQFLRRVRRFAAGHASGGLGWMHQGAGEMLERLEELRPQQLTLAETARTTDGGNTRCARRAEIAASVAEVQRVAGEGR